MRPDEPTVPPLSQGRWRSVRRLTERKVRRDRGRFLVEGPQAAREALALPERVVATYLADECATRHPDLLAAARAAGEVWTVTDEQLAGLSDAVTPQGIVVELTASETTLAEALGEAPRLVVICAAVRDPGNAGTVIRCADAFGADAVVLTEGSVELANPKTVRASVGSLFHLPVVTGVALADAVDAVRERGCRVLAADGGGEQLDALDAAGDLAGPTAWILGNEAWGLPEADAALADRVVGVPLWGRAESLNLATAAAVCLFTTGSAQRRESAAPWLH